MRIRWTKAASQDLDNIEEYIREYNPKAAIKQVLRVIDAVETKLSNSPGMGKPGRIAETREFYVTGSPYIVAFRINENTMEILRVIHGARQWPQKM
ncbi:MAG TPA: type II toxin-antitoxin system RelE/ParE family toxin [Candidatus Kapabacteria bacterium]|nr:type II toxin-antitoxin system RelE/ParE family toxin [Candidatus Kapabacteria bacterium]